MQNLSNKIIDGDQINDQTSFTYNFRFRIDQFLFWGIADMGPGVFLPKFDNDTLVSDQVKEKAKR